MKLIQTLEYLLLVDEDATIVEYDCMYDIDGDVGYAYGNDPKQWEGNSKVVGYYVLTEDELPLENVPLLPNPFNEGLEAMILGMEQYPHRDNNNDLALGGFVRGFKAGKTHQFTVEDMINAFDQGSNVGAHYNSWCDDFDNLETIKEAGEYADSVRQDFIQSLKTSKLPTEFTPVTIATIPYTFKDNSFRDRVTFKGLMAGDILIANQDENGIGGDFIQFPMVLIIKDKEYKVSRVSSFGMYNVPWIQDEDGNQQVPYISEFRLKDEGKLRTIINAQGKEELIGKYN